MNFLTIRPSLTATKFTVLNLNILNGEKVPQVLLMPSVVVAQNNLAAYLDGKLWTEPVAGQPELVSGQPA